MEEILFGLLRLDCRPTATHPNGKIATLPLAAVSVMSSTKKD
jgi:hypothetical protein